MRQLESHEWPAKHNEDPVSVLCAIKGLNRPGYGANICPYYSLLGDYEGCMMIRHGITYTRSL